MFMGGVICQVKGCRCFFFHSTEERQKKHVGFVRFGPDINTTVVEEKLNSIWFDSYKLKANLSKFSREWDKKSTYGNNSLSAIIPKSAFRKEETLYLETMGNQHAPNPIVEGKEPNLNKLFERTHRYTGMQFSSSEEDKRWLKSCFIGKKGSLPMAESEIFATQWKYWRVDISQVI